MAIIASLSTEWGGILVALLALVFTVASFWWLNARRGRVIAAAPHAYAVAAPPGTFRLRLPLAVYNTGARALIVRDLRCWFPDTTQTIAIPWITVRKTLRPEPDDVSDFATPFPVRGREAISIIAEFGCPFPGFEFGEGKFQVEIEVLDGDRDSWRRLVAFPLYVTAPTDMLARYIAHSNLPVDQRTRDKVVDSASRLLRDLADPPDPDASSP